MTNLSSRARLSLLSCGALLAAELPVAAQNAQWVRQLGTSAHDWDYAAAPDGSGGLYIGGVTYGNLGGPNAGDTDIWLAHYDTAGNQLWVRQFGTSTYDAAVAIAADGLGGEFICGLTYGDLGAASAGSADVWLARHDGAGNQLWVRQFGTSTHETAMAAAPDGSGGVYVCGDTFGSLAGPNQGGYDAWLARYDTVGSQLWIRQLGTSDNDWIAAAATDGSGGVYVCGSTLGSLGGSNPGGLFYDSWLARYDLAGNQVWVRQLGTSLDDFAYAAAPDGSGGVYLCGTTFGSLGGSSAGVSDVYLARYDPAGNQIWVRQFGTSNDDEGRAAAPDRSGGVIVAGKTTASLGGPNAGSWDAWLAGYDSAGNQRWVRQLGTSLVESADAAAPDGSGGVYIAGFTWGNLGGTSAGPIDAWFARYAPPAALLCEPGVGGVIACPCSNPASGPGHACDNSSGSGGATLYALGVAGLSADTLSFTAQGEKPTAMSVLLQGTSESASGLVFGQGVRCLSGSLRRLYVRAASGGAVTMPDFLAADASITVRSAALGDTILAGQSRWYSIYYRDPVVLGGCPSASTFNTGPTMRADWQP